MNTRASHHGHTLVFTRFSIGQWTLWEAGHNSQYKESPFTPGLSAGGRLHGFLLKKVVFHFRNAIHGNYLIIKVQFTLFTRVTCQRAAATRGGDQGGESKMVRGDLFWMNVTWQGGGGDIFHFSLCGHILGWTNLRPMDSGCMHYNTQCRLFRPHISKSTFT